jgi:hypothetical protein
MAYFGPEQPMAFFVQPGHGFLWPRIARAVAHGLVFLTPGLDLLFVGAHGLNCSGPSGVAPVEASFLWALAGALGPERRRSRMATQVLCDKCNQPIDQTEAYYQVTATKVLVENANDPSLPAQSVTVEIAQQFDYHDGHQPKTKEHGKPDQELPADDLHPEHPIAMDETDEGKKPKP